MLSAVRHRFRSAAAAVPEATTWIIEPQRTGLVGRARELMRYRRVLTFLAVRAIKERYEDTTLGIFWLFARPLAPILISTAIFGGLLGIASDGVPYFLFFLVGIVNWQLFERSVLWGTRSLEQHRGLIKKLYFPRLIVPVASLAPAVADFFIYAGLLVAATAYFAITDGQVYVRPGWRIFAAVGTSCLAVLCAISVVLWTSVFQMWHRDVRYTIRYVMQFWFYLTPVIYPMSAVPEQYRWLVFLNPLASIVVTFKWAMLRVGELPVVPLITGTSTAVVLLIAGLVFFTANEGSAVDRM